MVVPAQTVLLRHSDGLRTTHLLESDKLAANTIGGVIKKNLDSSKEGVTMNIQSIAEIKV